MGHWRAREWSQMNYGNMKTPTLAKHTMSVIDRYRARNFRKVRNVCPLQIPAWYSIQLGATCCIWWNCMLLADVGHACVFVCSPWHGYLQLFVCWVVFVSVPRFSPSFSTVDVDVEIMTVGNSMWLVRVVVPSSIVAHYILLDLCVFQYIRTISVRSFVLLEAGKKYILTICWYVWTFMTVFWNKQKCNEPWYLSIQLSARELRAVPICQKRTMHR